jgi:hypothetical protein
MVYVAFGGGSDPDPDSAADELCQAGYEVHRMPANHPILCHPLDDHIEAVIAGANDDRIIEAAMNEVSGIVDRYGGAVIEWGVIGLDYVPFKDLFADTLDGQPMADFSILRRS